jgi:hypothetical protein
MQTCRVSLLEQARDGFVGGRGVAFFRALSGCPVDKNNPGHLSRAKSWVPPGEGSKREGYWITAM